MTQEVTFLGVFNPQIAMVQTPVPIIPNLRRCKFNSAIVNPQQSTIMDQIIRGLRSSKIQECDIDMPFLAHALSNLIPRMTKTVMEIILDYRSANPDEVQIMGKKGSAPYEGHYDPASNCTGFDLRNLPDSLVIILAEFVKLVKTHAK